VPEATSAPADRPASVRWAAALAVALSLPWFLGALGAEFLTWDDDRLLVVNDRYRGFGAAHLRWMFTNVLLGHWQPLTWLSFATDHAAWGMTPAGYHATNLALHALNVALVFALVRRLLEPATAASPWAAAAGAVLFGAHPLRVESVVWVTERRQLLTTALLLAALLCYLGRSKRRTIAALGAHALAMTASTWGVVLPPILWLLDRRARPGEPRRAVVLRLLPFAAVAAAGLAVNVFACAVAGTGRSLAAHSVIQRVVQAAYGLWFYLARTVVSTGQTPLHELPARLDPTEPRFVVACAGVAALALVIVRLRRRFPGLATAALAYVVVLFPVLGLYQPVGLPLVAERYSYLALIPWIVVFAAVLAAARASRFGRFVAGPWPAVALAVALGPLAVRTTRVFSDSVSLWTRAVEIDPHSYVARTNLGHALELRGRVPQAIEQYRESLALRPDEPRTRYKLGLAYARQHRYAEAIGEWREVMRIAPEMPAVHYCIGLASFRLGRPAEAVAAYSRAVALEPGYVDAHAAMSEALEMLGRRDEAHAARTAAAAVTTPYRPPY
jgi:tetratricopeptide (TPR) repeat protein